MEQLVSHSKDFDKISYLSISKKNVSREFKFH